MAVWPNGKRTPPTVTSPYGYSAGYDGMHWGLDTIGHYYNHALDDGIVLYIGWNSFGDHRGGGGWEVWVRLDNGDVIVYYHNRRGLLVAKGDRVVAGTKLGIQSNSGYSFGIHCHTEVWLGGRRDRRTDPFTYIRALVGSKPAGGEPITLPKDEDEMKIIYRHSKNPSTNKIEFGIFGQTLSGGHRLSTHVPTAEAWGKLYGKPDGDSWGFVEFDEWLVMQAESAALNADWRAQLSNSQLSE